MTTAYLGSLTLGAALPGGQSAGLAAVAGINAALPNLVAQLEALQGFTPQPISFAAQIAGLQAAITGLQASMALGLSVPSVSAQLLELAARIAALVAQIGNINAQLSIVQAFLGGLGAAGVHAFAFDGNVAALGPELDTALAGVPGLGPADHCNAVAFATTVPATWAAIAALFKVTP